MDNSPINRGAKSATDSSENLSLRPEDLDDLLTKAAERGAERCLAHLGLENGHAAKDIRGSLSVTSWTPGAMQDTPYGRQPSKYSQLACSLR